MTRKELAEIIHRSAYCPRYSCNLPDKDSTGECCRECAERQLSEYEGAILARDTPKRPRKEWNSDHTRDWPVCPICGYGVKEFFRLFNFCANCGQRIDWNKEDK